MSFAFREVLNWVSGRFVNENSLEIPLERISVERPASLASSKEGDLAFFFSRDYEKELLSASPGILITGEPFVGPLEAAKLPLWKKSAIIACKDPYYAMALLSGKFAQAISSVAWVEGGTKKEIHPASHVDPAAEIAEGVRIGPHCVVEAKAKIGRGTVLYPGCVIGPGCKIGENCVLFPGVTLYEWTELGNRVRLHAGSVLGADGFGYAQKRDGNGKVEHQKIYHLGKVVVGDGAEIGANSCVDRGTFGETRIGRNAKLDNLVHVGHNSFVGEGAIICGGTCLAGNAVVVRYAMVGGLTGITNHVQVGDGASVGAMTLVTKDVPAGGTAVGVPQREYKEHFQTHALLSRLLADRKSRKGGSRG